MVHTAHQGVAGPLGTAEATRAVAAGAVWTLTAEIGCRRTARKGNVSFL